MQHIPRVRFKTGQGLSYSQPTHYCDGADGFVVTRDITNRKPSSPQLGLTEEEARQLHQVQDMNEDLYAAKKKKLRAILSQRVSDATQAIQVRGRSWSENSAEALRSRYSSKIVDEVALTRHQALVRAARASKKRRDRNHHEKQIRRAKGYGGRGSTEQRGNSIRHGRRDLSGRSNGNR